MQKLVLQLLLCVMWTMISFAQEQSEGLPDGLDFDALPQPRDEARLIGNFAETANDDSGQSGQGSSEGPSMFWQDWSSRLGAETWFETNEYEARLIGTLAMSRIAPIGLSQIDGLPGETTSAFEEVASSFVWLGQETVDQTHVLDLSRFDDFDRVIEEKLITDRSLDLIEYRVSGVFDEAFSTALGVQSISIVQEPLPEMARVPVDVIIDFGSSFVTLSPGTSVVIETDRAPYEVSVFVSETDYSFGRGDGFESLIDLQIKRVAEDR